MTEPVISSSVMTRRSALALSTVTTTLALTTHQTRAEPRQSAASIVREPLGIGLEGWPYPGPVLFLPLIMEGQPVRMAYMDFAPTSAANGRTIMLLHGKNFDGSYWSEPIQWLRSGGFRVIVPDQIGFNKSSKPDIDYSFEALAHNTLALADALSLGRFILLGHSTGGALAVRIASIAAERIEQLVLEDPIGLVDYRNFIPPQETATLIAVEHAHTAVSYRAFIAHFFHSLPENAYEPFVVWRMRVALSSEFDRFARASALTYQMIYREPSRPLYASLSMPVMLTAGMQDRSAPLISYASVAKRAAMPSIHQAAQQVVNELRDGRFVSFSNVGHVPHLEAADRFRAELLSFLKI